MRLLVKRMIRNQVRNGFLSSVFLVLVVIAASTSLMMYEHTRNSARIYDDFYAETNLQDLSVTPQIGHTFSTDNLTRACAASQEEFAGTDLAINSCETRYLHSDSFVKTVDGNESLIPLVAHGFVDSPKISTTWVEEDWGRMPIATGEVAIDRHMNDELKIEIGDEITVVLNGSKVNLTVTGYANHPAHLWYVPSKDNFLPGEGVFAVIYMPIDDLTNALNHSIGQRNTMLIDVVGTPDYDLQDTLEDEGVRLDALRESLENSLLTEGVEDAQIVDRSGLMSVELLRQDLEGNRKSTPLFLALLTGISALVISISLERLVRRQSKEIAVLRTVGVGSGPLLLSYLAVPMFHGIVGGAVAIPLGRLLSTAMTTWYFEDMIGIPIVELHHYSDIAMKVIGAVLAILLLFGLWPAWRATKLSPLEVMRIQAGARPNKFISWLTSALPPSAGLGIRGTFRHPMRLTMTVVGLGLSMIIVGGMSMITIGMHDWVSDTQQADTWDVSVALNPIFNEHVVEWVDDNQDNYETEWAVVFPFTATDDRRAIMVHGVEEFSDDGTATMHKSRLLDGRLPVVDQPIPEVVAEQGVAEFLGWQIGDQISLHIGVMDFPFKVVGIVDEGDRSVWVHRADLVRDIGSIGENVHNMLYLRNIGGADAANDTSLQELSGTTMLVHADIVEAFDEAWEKNSAGFKIFIAVGAAIAFAVLLNTLAINLTEHDNEFATLRILGASTGRIATILCFENIVIGILGGLAGAYASIKTAMWLGSEFTTWSWYFSFPIRWDIAFLVVALILLCSLAVTPVGARRVRRMDLVKKAQEFSY